MTRFSHLQEIKLRTIDWAFERVGVSSFADLGGVWAVDGGYAQYALERPGVSTGYLVDDLIDDLSDEAKSSGLDLIKSPLGDAVGSFGSVDALLMFDILLHQVNPDWDDFIRAYAEVTRSFVIVTPQYDGERTERLIELGKDRYLELVPQNDVHDALFDRLDEPHRGRTWRDVHDVWQWGLRDEELTELITSLGFKLLYFQNAGPWMENPYFHNSALVFARD